RPDEGPGLRQGLSLRARRLRRPARLRRFEPPASAAPGGVSARRPQRATLLRAGRTRQRGLDPGVAAAPARRRRYQLLSRACVWGSVMALGSLNASISSKAQRTAADDYTILWKSDRRGRAAAELLHSHTGERSAIGRAAHA